MPSLFLLLGRWSFCCSSPHFRGSEVVMEREEENMDIQNCLELLKNLENLQPSDFVYVGLKKNKGSNQMYSSKHFVGQVIQMEEDEVEIYMRTSGSSFTWPEVEDIGWTSRDNTHLFLVSSLLITDIISLLMILTK